MIFWLLFGIAYMACLAIAFFTRWVLVLCGLVLWATAMGLAWLFLRIKQRGRA